MALRHSFLFQQLPKYHHQKLTPYFHLKVNQNQSKVEFSYDIVILKDVDSIPQILRVNKQGNSKNYQWVKLPDMRGFYEKFNLINGNEMWEELKTRYYKKKMDKINGVKYQDKKSYK